MQKTRPIPDARSFTLLLAGCLLLSGDSLWASDRQSFALRENGSIAVWSVAGPFPNGKPLSHGPGCFGFFLDFLEEVGGESAVDPAEGQIIPCAGRAPLVWRTALSDSDGLLDFIDLCEVDRETPGVAYAFVTLSSKKDFDATLKVRSNDGVRVWLNGERVFENHVGRSLDEGGEDLVPVRLEEGANRLLVKVDQGGGDWGTRVALDSPDPQFPACLRAGVSVSQVLEGKFLAALFEATCLVKKTPEGARQILVAEIDSGGNSQVVCHIEKDEWATPLAVDLGDLGIGRHRIEIPIPVLERTGPARITLESTTDRQVFESVPLAEPLEWTVYLVQHTHHDIGYTRAQHEILPAFLEYIDAALDYCDRTEDFPEDAQFRWTCEISWPVREYLKRRPAEQIKRLRERVAEGRIEIAGLFLNLDEIADENLLAASLQPIREFRKQGLPVTTAMQNDVPGVAWCLVDYLSDIKVPYLIMGINNDRTPRPFDIPTALWWESPSGSRVLAWRPDHYHTGNHLRIHQGKLEPLKKKLLQYLGGLEERGYPFDRIAAQYSGMQIDNSPPAVGECETIREWNDTYLWPHLRSSLAREFLEYIEAHHAGDLPTYRGAWPNWWTDGYAFAHVETAKARKAHTDLLMTEGLLSIASLLGSTRLPSVPTDIQSIEDDLLFHDEHTYGAQEEFTQPMAENSVVQWGEKVATVWDALQRLGILQESAWGSLQPFLGRDQVPTITIANTLPWDRSGECEVYIGHEILPLGKVFRIMDLQTGEEIACEVAKSRFEGSYWNLWVKDVPAMGWKTLRIEVGEEESKPENGESFSGDVLEDEHYRIKANPETGALSSLFDKELGKELVDASAEYDFGQFIRDRLSDPHFYDRESFLARSSRSSVRDVKISIPPETTLWKSLLITAKADGCIQSETQPGLECKIRLLKAEKRVEFHYTIRKAYVDSPESVYIAFPFHSPDGQVAYEAQGGLVRPGIDQLPGSSSDWHTIQNFLTIRDTEAQCVLSSEEIPLVQFGDINLGKWQKVAEVKRPYVYSWVMNNYWTSGFRGSKESEFRWSYSLTSLADISSSAATKRGYGFRQPLVARVSPGNLREAGYSNLSTLKIGPSNVLVVNTAPETEGRAVRLHLRELEGQRTAVRFEGFEGKAPRIDRLDVLGSLLEGDVAELWLEPFETGFVRLSF